ncbi:MAG: RHS repeat-associated core domain-containing protein [Candidatus Omnitrophica bacterium]|nr:RHS repeat-associated core domain-containing protein [Candidatus Omnitrophota bacterium]
MFKKILNASLIVLHLLTQSASAFEFQSIAIQSSLTSSDIFKNENPLSGVTPFLFSKISEPVVNQALVFDQGLSVLSHGSADQTLANSTSWRLPSAYLRALSEVKARGAAPRRPLVLSNGRLGVVDRFLSMNDKSPENSVLEIYHLDWLKEGQQKDLTGTAVKQTIYTFNIADELLTLNNKLSTGTVISKHDYTYDAVSNRKTHAITAAANKNYTYDYNSIYELTGVTGSETSTYAYDKVGNRTTANGVAYTSNNLNQYTAVGGVARTYDTKGNLTGDAGNTYGYDVESRLKTFSKTGTTASYGYDAFNRRVSKTVNGTATFYVYDGDDIIEERNSAGTLVADYVHGDQTDEPLTMTRGTTTYYYFADGLGSIRQLTNSAGAVQQTYDYNSYGKLAAAPTIVNPFTYTGREYDVESGNYYYRARYYSPTLGRFLQRDPIGYADSMNLQQYVGNNSINFIDPTGEFVAAAAPWWPILAGPEFWIGAAIVGGGFAIWNAANNSGGFHFPDMSWPWQSTPTTPGGQVCPLNGTWGNTTPPPGLNDPLLSKGGKQNQRDTGLANLSDEEVSRRARDKSLSGEERRRYQKEEKARGTRNKQKR